MKVGPGGDIGGGVRSGREGVCLKVCVCGQGVAIKKRVWHQQVLTGQLCYCSADISSRAPSLPPGERVERRGRSGVNAPSVNIIEFSLNGWCRCHPVPCCCSRCRRKCQSSQRSPAVEKWEGVGWGWGVGGEWESWVVVLECDRTINTPGFVWLRWIAKLAGQARRAESNRKLSHHQVL